MTSKLQHLWPLLEGIQYNNVHFNTELYDLRKNIYLRKSDVLKRISYNVIENWWSIAYPVCHAPKQMTSESIIIASMTSH